MKATHFILRFFALTLLFAALWSCDDPGDDFVNDEVPQGQIWAEINGTFFRFDDASGILETDANSYASQVRLLSIFRRVSVGDFFGTMRIKINPINLDEVTAPQTFTQSANITFNPQPNDPYTGKDGETSIEITSIEGDVIKGTFSGTVRSIDNPAFTFNVRNGRFHIRVTRF